MNKHIDDHNDWIEITTELRLKLHSERFRTGVNFARLLQLAKNVPDTLNADKLQRWSSNQRRAPKALLDFVFCAYEKHPTIEIADPETLPPPIQRPRTGLSVTGQTRLRKSSKDATRIILTQCDLTKLENEKARTNVKSQKLYRITPNWPDDLGFQMIDNWGKDAKTAVKAHLDFVFAAYEKLPDAVPSITVTDQMRAQLKALWRCVPRGYLKQAPTSFTSGQVLRIINRNGATMPRPLWDYCLKDIKTLYQPQPSPIQPDLLPAHTHLETPKIRASLSVHEHLNRLPGVDYMDLNTEHLTTLISERERTAVSHIAIIREGLNPPEGLVIATVRLWLLGKVRHAERRYYEWIVQTYSTLPTAIPQ